MKIILVVLISLFTSSIFANTRQFFEKEFASLDGCFILIDIETNKVVDEFNAKRCQKRFPPMSTFKIPLAAIAFESGYFQDVDQKIKWDGKKRGRKAVNADQTPKTFIAYSVIWVSRLIVNFLGQKSVETYVKKLNYGNTLVSGDLENFWLTKGSIKVSPYEQVQFLSNLWQEKLPLTKKVVQQVKDVTFDRTINDFKIFGKTGTGCIDEGCENKPGRQLGWFVGIAEKNKKTFAFALNYSDRDPRRGYAGPAGRKMVHRYFEKLK